MMKLLLETMESQLNEILLSNNRIGLYVWYESFHLNENFMEWIGIQCDLHRKGITCFHSVCPSRPFNLDTKPLFLVSLDTNPKELLLSGDIETNPGPTHYKSLTNCPNVTKIKVRNAFF